MPRGIYDRQRRPASTPKRKDLVGLSEAYAAARGHRDEQERIRAEESAEEPVTQAPVGLTDSVPDTGTDAEEEPEALPAADSSAESCPKCGQPMQCYGNLEGKIVPMNPPEEDATWACHDCKVKRKVRRQVQLRENFELVRFYELLA